eukprot:scaffold37304_cov79-Cyclotella_meneghiniana.AAC.2
MATSSHILSQPMALPVGYGRANFRFMRRNSLVKALAPQESHSPQPSPNYNLPRAVSGKTDDTRGKLYRTTRRHPLHAKKLGVFTEDPDYQ